MKYRTLGTHGLQVSAIGYGAMVLVQGMYGDVEEEQSIRTIQHALDVGITMIDTSDAYGADGHNERLVGRAVAGRRDQAVIATKFGYALSPDEDGTPIQTNWDIAPRVNGRPEVAKQRIDDSLRRLGVEMIDLWYLHFPDPAVPIEDTVGAMADAVNAGKVRYLGLSNVDAEQIRRAHAVHPISAVQNEYSLWTRNVEVDILPTLRELGIGLVPWAPLGSGFLSGQVTNVDQNDFRSRHPRYQAENLRQNVDRFAPLRALAEELNITPAQLALAWLLHQGSDIVPIPGTRKPEHIDSNAAAVDVVLTPEHLARIAEAAPLGLAAGKSLRE
jgi:aryl-alcohol dehydrogenase-like predicted oxidoreductase